jgi:hypothetical protein
VQEHEINKLNNFICGYYFEDTSMLDEIISYFKLEEQNANRGVLVKNGVRSVITSEKDSYDLPLPSLDFSHKYFENLQKCLDLYLHKYKAANDCSTFSADTPNIQLYKPSGHYNRWHCERSSGVSRISSRHLVFMTYLNDVKEGGETEFFYQNLKVKPEKGLTLIWPTDWTHTHRGIPTLNEEKMIVTGWFSFNSI